MNQTIYKSLLIAKIIAKLTHKIVFAMYIDYDKKLIGYIVSKNFSNHKS